MRQFLKFLHTLASCGLIGAVLGYIIVLVYAPQDTPVEYAAARQTISHLCNYLLIPSLGICLATGLLSIAVHQPFQQRRWVWVKAALGISMFEATLGIVQSKAEYAARLSQQIVEGKLTAEALKADIAAEWYALAVIMILSVVNIVLGVWRPKLKWKPASTARAET